jgi:hypothetical protein
MLYATKIFNISTFFSLALLLISSAACAENNEYLSHILQICAKSIPGVAYTRSQGIDAVEGEAKNKYGIVKFMVSRHPNLPDEMGLKPNKESVISLELKDDLTFIRESTSRNGLGVERLYGYSLGLVQGPSESFQDQIFVELWTDGGRHSTVLLKKIGDAIFRCRPPVK